MKHRLYTSVIFLTLSLNWLFAQANFYDQVDYKGAFGPTDWTQGWTALYQYGVTAEAATSEGDVNVTTDISGEEFWTADHTYLLNGRIFVNDGAVLHIEAGTVIKGLPGSDENASALIVARGGKIYAEGTATHPIIFTASSDDVSNPSDISYQTTGLWGGVIILGKAKINRPAGEFNIEGIPTTEPRGLYGGTDDDDNSGVFRYVSIRHGGVSIGADNEINGLTLGGVGRGTTIDHVEVFANVDDGFEWFGGTVNCKNLISAFNGDDGFDFDEGYRGKLQYLFVLQAEGYGNHCGEHDGAPASAVTTEPKAYPVIYNATYLGSGKNSENGDQEALFLMREAFGGEYKNCIFGDYNGYGLDISGKLSPDDSKDRLAAGELLIENNIWFDLGNYTMSDSIGKEDYVQAYLQNAANGNSEEDPMLAAIDRGQNGLLDPRPATDGPAWENLAAYSVTSIKEKFVSANALPKAYTLNQNYPNPFNPSTTIEYKVPYSGEVTLTIYNVLGQKVANLVDGVKQAGTYQVTFDAGQLASGIYIYQLRSAGTVLTKKMTLIK